MNRNHKNSFISEMILNEGLDLAMEFSKNWLQPIQERLKVRYSYLSKIELETLNDECISAMRFGHKIIYDLIKINGKNFDQKKAINEIKNKYHWINDKNLDHLISQGIYYAFKNGLI